MEGGTEGADTAIEEEGGKEERVAVVVVDEREEEDREKAGDAVGVLPLLLLLLLPVLAAWLPLGLPAVGSKPRQKRRQAATASSGR